MRFLFGSSISKFLFFFSFNLIVLTSIAQHSVARKWNEVLLQAIRHDYARPTIHARNLFHSSILLYDAWALYDDSANTYFIGKELAGFYCAYDSSLTNYNIDSVEVAMSFAQYRLLNHRFRKSPGSIESLKRFDSLMISLGLDTSFVSIDYGQYGAKAFGNYLGEQMIKFGLQDGSNEDVDYQNYYYRPFNKTLLPVLPGNPDMSDPNRWQPLTLETYIDQSGHVQPKKTPDFLSPEWGNVVPFALSEANKTIYERNGNEYVVYHDPGKPPFLTVAEERAFYKWGFELVSIWSSHLDTTDNKMIDISPSSIGNNPAYPQKWSDYSGFYKVEDGGDASRGYTVNPKTKKPYQKQMIRRGDFTRVLAEFWADGPSSETPPGHWFTILNYVSDHDSIVKKVAGQGDVLSDLEWDVKSYFLLAGTVHDAAVTAWGIKGWYDYTRPISAIRYMARMGQSSDVNLPNYHIEGITLRTGFIELVKSGDPLAGVNGVNIGKVKLKAWKGPDYITDEKIDAAGVGWILAENWWPYQRPTFVTPPFAGYISGHSVFSRAAAEVMTLFTGDPFFPGGLGEFHAGKNEFLVFEEGPSTDVVLQWATYKDASDQTSLSRIWGGIHPPVDDIPGRIIGKEIGQDAFTLAMQYFNTTVTGTKDKKNMACLNLYPNPSRGNVRISGLSALEIETIEVFNLDLKKIFSNHVKQDYMILNDLEPGMYILKCISQNKLTLTEKFVVLD